MIQSSCWSVAQGGGGERTERCQRRSPGYLNSEGEPSVRMVLVKRADQRGFCFYTNAESRRGWSCRRIPGRPSVFTGRRWSGRCGWRAGNRDGGGRCGRVFPQPVAQQPDRCCRLGAEPANWGAGRSWKPGSGDSPSSIRARCLGRPTGAASVCMRSGSSSGSTGRTGCTTGSCLPAIAVNGGEPGCIHERVDRVAESIL